MSCFFSAVVSCTIESSKSTPTSPSSGRSSPNVLAQASSARLTPQIAPCMAFSFLRMLRMSAELSLETSVAVFTYPTLSKSK